MTAPTNAELETIYYLINKVEQVRSTGIKKLSDLFDENPRLIISPTSICHGACLHCATDSTPVGGTLSYDDFIGIDPEFIHVFAGVDFGRRGNPLLYDSGGHDLVDLMIFLQDNGIAEFTLALPLQLTPIPVLARLEEFATREGVKIETMVTYHHYWQSFDAIQLARDFNVTLKNYLGFSRLIYVSLLGDRFGQQDPTVADEVEQAFYTNWDIIFGDIVMIPTENVNIYHAQYCSIESEIEIAPINTHIYPLGRFRNYLTHKGLLHQYMERFDQEDGNHVCPDMIKWPAIILEPDGNLNLCGDFASVETNGAIASNILAKPFSLIQDDLMLFHQREMRWFIDNLPDIIAGNVSTCKLKNGCFNQIK